MTQINRPADGPSCCPDLGAHPAFRLFRVLSDPNRVALLARIAACGRPCTVTELSTCCAVDLSGVSRHLAALREAGVLHSERQGREVHYSIRAGPVAGLLRALADALEGCCPPVVSLTVPSPRAAGAPSPTAPGRAAAPEPEE